MLLNLLDHQYTAYSLSHELNRDSNNAPAQILFSYFASVSTS